MAERAVKRAAKAAAKAAKLAFHEGVESWMRRLRYDGGNGPSGGGGLGSGLGGGLGGGGGGGVSQVMMRCDAIKGELLAIEQGGAA